MVHVVGLQVGGASLPQHHALVLRGIRGVRIRTSSAPLLARRQDLQSGRRIARDVAGEWGAACLLWAGHGGEAAL